MLKKALVSFTDSGDISSCDAIEHEGQIWLVPNWTTNPATGLSRPVRIMRVDHFGLQMAPFAGHHFVVQALKVSKAVLEGRAPPREEDEVVESPEIEIRLDAN